MMFTETYKDVLSPFLNKFREAQIESERKAAVMAAMVAVRAYSETCEGDDANPLPENLDTVR